MIGLRRPSRMKRYLYALAVLIAIDVTMHILFGPTEVTGFQIVVAAFIATWLEDEVPA